MTAPVGPVPTAAPTASAGPVATAGRLRRIPLGAGGWVAVGILSLVLSAAVLAPVLVSAEPNSMSLSYAYVGPVAGHPLGFDGQGRDLLARLVHGARPALIGPLLVIVASTVLGSTIALASAWIGGTFDAVVARVTDAMFAFPGLLLAILAVSLYEPGLTVAAGALSISYTPYVTRIIRSAALKERSLPYIAALRVQGFSGTSIVLRHLLPNIAVTVVSVAALSFGYALIDLAALSFTGLGVQAPQADWGVMVATGIQGILAGYPQESLFAGALIVITVGAVNYLGDRLADAAEVAG